MEFSAARDSLCQPLAGFPLTPQRRHGFQNCPRHKLKTKRIITYFLSSLLLKKCQDSFTQCILSFMKYYPFIFLHCFVVFRNSIGHYYFVVEFDWNEQLKLSYNYRIRLYLPITSIRCVSKNLSQVYSSHLAPHPLCMQQSGFHKKYHCRIWR